MKKYLLSFLLIATSGWYAVHNALAHQEGQPHTPNTDSQTSNTPPSSNSSETSPHTGSTSVPVEITNPQTTNAPSPSSSGIYKDGSYTGSVADAYYGPMQVKAVITHGRITDVIFLQYPNDRRDSVQINQEAMPLLKQEAIEAQSADVAGVTGASESSAAFIQTLGDALLKAKV